MLASSDQHWGWYGTKTLQMVPIMPGTPAYRDGVLSHLYYQTRDQGKIKDTFCGEEKSHDQFVFYFESLKTAQVLCTVSDAGKLNIVGYSWVCMPRGVDGGRAAQCGFCFLEDGSNGKSNARDLARLAVAYAFQALRIDVLHGVQQVSNLAARNFSRRIGFTECAIVPGYHAVDGHLEDARVMILRKTDFWPKFIEWKQSQPKVE